ncbi:GTP cyclohydrolase I [Segniliparus rugosus]|uniref:GTP cyclohydrolase I n=1 Tax=Segniliparus rugosus TaxID=286804 RepID=UPI001FCCABE4|nr:GTP cyclohydrolase I [Segniliparus rugosus]
MIDLQKAEIAVAELLNALGVDEGEHTRDTPGRVAKAWAEALAGYEQDPARHLLRTFEAFDDPGLVIVGGVRVVSTCAHHLLPIVGHATVAYRPQASSEIVGLSKLARLVHGYSRRLQVQERIGRQVVTAIQDNLAPVGSACVISARHGCMEVRGVMQSNSVTTTHATSGEWTLSHPDMQAVMAEHARQG